MVFNLSITTFARFGQYGIKDQASPEGYQQYVGQTVKYIDRTGKGRKHESLDEFFKEGGDFAKEYTILKINYSKGSYGQEKLTFTLQEKNGKKKIKITSRESFSTVSGLEHISDIPILFIEKMNSDKTMLLEKYAASRIGITNIILQPSDKDPYPSVVFEITDKKDNTKYYSNLEYSEEIERDLGKVFTNPNFKCDYTIVNVYRDEKDSSYDWNKHYILKNSMDGSTEDLSAKIAEEYIFERAGNGRFYATLKEVEKPANSSIRYGTTNSIKDKDITKFSYVDNVLDILIFASEKLFSFTLKNNSDNSIKIVWNEAVFVDVDGTTSKIMHQGTKFSQREADQPASTIIKGAKIDDTIVPTDRVYYSDLYKDWDIKSLYDKADKTKAGQMIQTMLPIQIKDVVNEYVFKFEITYKYDHPEYFK